MPLNGHVLENGRGQHQDWAEGQENRRTGGGDRRQGETRKSAERPRL